MKRACDREVVAHTQSHEANYLLIDLCNPEAAWRRCDPVVRTTRGGFEFVVSRNAGQVRLDAMGYVLSHVVVHLEPYAEPYRKPDAKSSSTEPAVLPKFEVGERTASPFPS